MLAIRFLTFFIFLVPSIGFFHVWPFNSIISDGLSLIVCFLLGALSLIKSRGTPPPVPSNVALLGLFVLSTAVSGLIAEYTYQTTFLWTLITLFAMIFASMGFGWLRRCVGNLEYISILAKYFIAGTIVYALFSLLIYYGIAGRWIEMMLPSGRLGGAWAQPNLTTTMLWLSIFASLNFSVFQLRSRFYYVILFIFSIVLALAASRLNFLYLIFLAGLGVVAFKWGNREANLKGRRMLQSAVAISVCLVIVPPASQMIDRKLAALGWLERAGAVSLVERGAIDSPRLIEQKKIGAMLSTLSVSDWMLGTGPGNYAVFSYNAPTIPVGPAGSQSTWLHSHNLFSMILVEQGVIGVTTIILIVVVLVSRLWLIRREVYALPIAGVLGILFIHSNLEFPLWYPWFLLILVAFSTPLFDNLSFKAESRYLLPLSGILVLVFTGLLTWNVGSQASTIIQAQAKESPSSEDYHELSLLANDGLMGPYAVLSKLRTFNPEMTNLPWQLKEARRIGEWRPFDFVALREVSILIMMEMENEACDRSRVVAEKYPASGPIIMEKAFLSGAIQPSALANLAQCVESGLMVWDETLSSVQMKNQYRMDQIRNKSEKH